MYAYLISFAVLAALALPVADAQLVIGEPANHKSLVIAINSDGSAHIMHEIYSNSSPVTMQSVSGSYDNIMMSDPDGNTVQHPISHGVDGFGVTIFMSGTNIIIEYDLPEAMTAVGGYQAWDYFYPETTLFGVPEDIGRVYINGAPIEFDNARFRCHGCDALIEYASEEPVQTHTVSYGGANHDIAVKSVTGVAAATFDTEQRALFLDLDVDDHAYLDIAIPHALLEGYYEAYREGERLVGRIESQNDTHSHFRTSMPDSGTLYVIVRNDTSANIPGVPDEPDIQNAGIPFGPIIVAVGAAGIAASLIIWKRRRSR